MKQQRGSTLLGFILGLVVGLAAALAVAVYVTKVPVPFVSKAVSRNPDLDATEQQKNKGWDPNAPLYGKNPAKPAGPPEQLEGTGTDTKKLLATPTAASAPAKPELKPAVTADPLGDLARTKVAASSKASAAGAAIDPFTYFVQVGAFRSAEDAETQHAKLSLGGIETTISQREERGQLMHRVRVGPFDTREAAEKTKQKLSAAGIETALVRVQR
jgi:cell division protein FtsN